MSRPLAIFLPTIGALSESFLRRHAQQLCPDRVVVIAERALTHWHANCPTLLLNQLPGAYRNFYRRVRARLGMPERELSGADRHCVREFLSIHKVKVILGEYLDFSCKWLPLAQGSNISFYAHAFGVDVSARLRDPYWRARYRELNQSAGIITISEVSRQRLIKHGLEPAKVHVIPCGVDVASTATKHPPSDAVRCLAVGRMVPKKAPLLTLEAFKRAVAAQSNLQLDYVGDGDLFRKAEEFIRAHGLAKYVTLHGEQPYGVVHELMKKADIFLQHSIIDPVTGDEEGLPVAILDAMAHAVPVVATRHAGIPEAVLDQETGFLVEEGDVEMMATRIVELARSEDTRAKLGFRALERARARFSWERERQALLELFQLS